MMLLEREKSLVLLVDVQERLLPAMTNGRECAENCGILLRAAADLRIPVLASEQYRRGLGPLVAPLAGLVPGENRFEKMEFSCYENSTIRDALSRAGRRQILLAGIEAHVCVLQTAEGLLAADFQVFVAADAVASRKVENRDLALRRLERGGAIIVSVEMALFEWLKTAEAAEFRGISKMIR
jgi:nicotinamidase-related amidase